MPKTKVRRNRRGGKVSRRSRGGQGLGEESVQPVADNTGSGVGSYVSGAYDSSKKAVSGAWSGITGLFSSKPSEPTPVPQMQSAGKKLRVSRSKSRSRRGGQQADGNPAPQIQAAGKKLRVSRSKSRSRRGGQQADGNPAPHDPYARSEAPINGGKRKSRRGRRGGDKLPEEDDV